MDTGTEGCYSQFQILTSRSFGSRSLWVTKSAKNSGRLNDLRRVYARNGNLTTEIRKNYQKNTRANSCKMTVIFYKYSKKGGTSRSFKKTIVILRTSNLQQPLILRVRIADITLNTRPGGSRTDGRESVDSLSGNKPKD
jgi:hypothetical protein